MTERLRIIVLSALVAASFIGAYVEFQSDAYTANDAEGAIMVESRREAQRQQVDALKKDATDAFGYVVGTSAPTHSNSCSPATTAACGKILEGVQGILVANAASAVITFTTN